MLQVPAEFEDEIIGVVVADDDERFRRVVVALLHSDDGITVLGEASDGREAVTLVHELVPDVVLLDVRMPGRDGLDAANEIHRTLPTTKVVMLTASDEEDDVYEALKAGASGYLLKEGLFEDLAGVVRGIAQGLGLVLSPSIAEKLLAEFREPPPRTTTTPGLTDRELEVLKLVSAGYANHEIARELHLSPHTVKRHVANILAKLQQRSRLEAVMHAIRSGVLVADAS